MVRGAQVQGMGRGTHVVDDSEGLKYWCSLLTTTWWL